jgi:hypothetical protein
VQNTSYLSCNGSNRRDTEGGLISIGISAALGESVPVCLLIEQLESPDQDSIAVLGGVIEKANPLTTILIPACRRAATAHVTVPLLPVYYSVVRRVQQYSLPRHL